MSSDFLLELSTKIGIPFDLFREIVFWSSAVILAVVFSFLIKQRFLISFFVCLFLSYVITLKSDFSFLDVGNFKAYYFLGLTIVFFWLLKDQFVLEFGGQKIISWGKSVIVSLAVFFVFVRFFFDFFPISTMEGTVFDFFYEVLFFGKFEIFWMLLPLVFLILFERRKL